MEIRLATAQDAQGIARVHVDSWRSTYRGIIPDEVLARLSVERRAEGWREAAALSGRSGRTLVVAEEDGQIVGFAAGGPERTGDPAHTGELYAIYILASHQGRRIGRSLVRHVVEALLSGGHHTMLLWVLATNTGAGRFYASLGGRVVCEQLTEIGGTGYPEIGYGWNDLPELLRRLSAAAGSPPGSAGTAG